MRDVIKERKQSFNVLFLFSWEIYERNREILKGNKRTKKVCIIIMKVTPQCFFKTDNITYTAHSDFILYFLLLRKIIKVFFFPKSEFCLWVYFHPHKLPLIVRVSKIYYHLLSNYILSRLQRQKSCFHSIWESFFIVVFNNYQPLESFVLKLSLISLREHYKDSSFTQFY